MNVITLLGGIRGTIFAGLALLALLFVGVQTARLASAHNDLDTQKLALVVSAQRFAEWKLKAEAEKAAAIAAIDKQHREEQARVKDQANRTIAELRSGNLQLRKRFTCPSQGQSNSPDPSVSRTDGEGEGGLTEQDAEFLVRQAEESDRKSVKINALIDVVEEMLRKQD